MGQLMRILIYFLVVILASSCTATGRIKGDKDFIDYKTLSSINNPIETKEIVYYRSSKFPTSNAERAEKEIDILIDVVTQERLINFTINTIELIFNEEELEKSRDKIRYSIEVENFWFNDDLTLFEKLFGINTLIPLLGELVKGIIRDESTSYEYYEQITIENIQIYSMLTSIAAITFAIAAPDHIWQKSQIGIVLNIDFFDLNDRPLKSIKIRSEIDQGDKKYHNKTGLFSGYRDEMLYKVIMDINEQLRSEIFGNKESFVPLPPKD